MKVYRSIGALRVQRKKNFAILIDPDKSQEPELQRLLEVAHTADIDYFFVGGSLISSQNFHCCIRILKSNTTIPVVLFPGDHFQLSDEADAILFLSLISGRNPDLLIGRHVLTAQFLKRSELEVIPTGYMIIDGGRATSASYMSNTTPIPSNKPDIAVSTAVAGELLGLRLIYMDAGSGAQAPLSCEMISSVHEAVKLPLIVGGGIKTPEEAQKAARAGADLIVVGNAIERKHQLITEISTAVHDSV